MFVTDYPQEIKAFYMRLNDDGKTVAAADCLVPGIGEIIGGSQREERIELLEKRIRELISGGTAVLIVSHSTTVLRRICSRVIWIEKGELRMDGAPDAVCLAYEKRK